MKRLKYLFTVAGLLLLVAVGILTMTNARAQEATPTPITPDLNVQEENILRSIQVSGQGQVSAAPDQAVIQLGVQTEAEEAAQALSENNQNMNDLIQVFRDANIPSEDIQTQGINLNPRYDNPQNGTPQVVGYVAENILKVKVEDLSRLGDLLDQAVQAGGNRINGISFEISNQQELLDQAREVAWENAQKKAQQLASLADASLGEVLTIRETSNQPGPVVPAVRSMAVEQAAVPVEPGSQSVSVQLDVTWRLQSGVGNENQP